MTSQTDIKNYLEGYDSDTLHLVGPFAAKISLKGPVLYIDSGVLNKVSPGLAIGDGDSSSAKQMDIVLNTDKDVSDLEYALLNIPKKYQNYKCHGFLGKRKDHEFSNLLCLIRFAKGQHCQISLDATIHIVTGIKASFDFCGVFSVFCFAENSKVTIMGAAKYTGEIALSPYSSHGLSNESYGVFSISTDSQCIVFFNRD